MLTSIEKIPDSLWLKIFKYLSMEDRCMGVRLTCQRWNRIMCDSVFWASIDFTPSSLSITDIMVENLLRKVGKHVKVISFRHCLKLSNYTLSLKMFRLEQLQYVDVSFTAINDDAFKTLTDKHSEIIGLRWRDCKNIKYPGKALQNLTNLRSLEIESTRKHAVVRKLSFNPVDVIKVVQRNPNISCLKFTSSLLLNKPGVLTSILPLVPNLTELSMTFLSDGCNIELASSLKFVPMLMVGCLPFHPGIISSLATNCPRLHSITFTDLVTSLDHEATIVSLKRLLKSCKSIRSLSINANYYCDSSALSLIANYAGKNLESLELHLVELSLDDFSTNFKLFPNLQELSIFLRYDMLGDSLLQVMSQSMMSLRSLHIANLFYTHNSLISFLSSAAKLEALVLSASRSVVDFENRHEGVKTRRCSLRNLSFVSPKDNLDEDFIVSLVACCPNLQGIMLEGIPRITDDLIISIARSCSQLKGLNIPSSGFSRAQIRSETIDYLCHHCPLLHSLTLPYSTASFGDNGAFELLIERALCLRKFSFWLNSPDDIASATNTVRHHRGQCYVSSMNKDKKQYDVSELYRIFDHQDYVSLLFPAVSGAHLGMPRSRCIGDSYFLF